MIRYIRHGDPAIAPFADNKMWTEAAEVGDYMMLGIYSLATAATVGWRAACEEERGGLWAVTGGSRGARCIPHV